MEFGIWNLGFGFEVGDWELRFEVGGLTSGGLGLRFGVWGLGFEV